MPLSLPVRPHLANACLLWAALCALCALCALGCDLPGKPDPANRPIPPHQVADFDVLFQHNCAGCHGREGKLGPAPPLNDPLFLSIVSDEALGMTISMGRSGTSMPAFNEDLAGTLTEKQIEILATGLKKKWPPDFKSDSGLPPYIGGTGDAQRGKQAYANACASCHGPQGEGIKDGAGAINNVAFLSLTSDQALRRIIITGRPDLGMPDYTGQSGRPKGYQALTSSEIDDIVALLAAWRKSNRLAADSPP